MQSARGLADPAGGREANPEVCAGFRGPAGGPGLVGPPLFEYWATHDCPSAFAAVLNGLPTQIGSVVTEVCAANPFGVQSCQGSTSCAGSTSVGGATVAISVPCSDTGVTAYVQAYNPAALPLVQSYLSGAYSAFAVTNAISPSPTSPSYSPFQDALLAACLDPRLPGACDGWLSQYCAAFPAPRDLNPATLDFCGCYTSAAAFPNIPPQCSPTCHRAATVQRADPATGAAARCTPDVCVITDVTVDLAASQIDGALNVVNFCPACGAGGCFCMISGVSVADTMGAVGLGENFAQYCGADSVCLQGTFPNVSSVPCLDAAAAAGAGRASASAVPWLFFVFLAFFVAAAGFALWAARPQKSRARMRPR